jgi:hypothetical protein
MRAIVCREYGPPEKLVIEERPLPQARAGEVVVQVNAAVSISPTCSSPRVAHSSRSSRRSRRASK